jgi:ADP-ribose pyrophosphatase YjhB (NUDIX family)
MTQEETVERALLEEADKLMTIEQKQVDALERISADQKRIDAQREAMADEIVAGQNIQTVEEGRRFARAWIITAAQHAANEAYYRKNRDEMFRAIKQAYRLLFDSQPIDVSDGIQETIAGHAAALGTLQAVVDEWANVCDPPPGAFSEDPTNEDGTADQVRERNRDTIATPPGPTPCAAVSYIERDDGRILAVWNRRSNGWAMPGGKVEDGETVGMAQARELLEETGLETAGVSLVYDAPTAIKDSAIPSDRGRHVFVFRVIAAGEPREMEAGCPVRWVTREEFLAESPFREFYREMFAKVPQEAR